MKPRVLRMTQVITIRLSQVVASSTARWLRDTMRITKATAAAVTAMIVDTPRILP